MSVPLASWRHKQPMFQAALLKEPLFIVVAMTLALALSFGNDRIVLTLIGLSGFLVLSLLRPDLGLLFVPVTAPFFILTVGMPYARGNVSPLPLYEIVLLLVLAATLLNGLWRWRSKPCMAFLALVQYAVRWLRWHWRSMLPYALFLGAGVFGLLLALPDAAPHAAAVRELYRFFIEPLLFYALLRWWLARDVRYGRWLVVTVSFSGAFVALLGLLQYVGFENVVTLLFNQTPHFADSVLITGNARRVTSVYSNPNILGLYLGRVWPLAAVLALAYWSRQHMAAWFFGGVVLLCLAGIAATFSRGAWIGVAGALLVLAAGLISRHERVNRVLLLIGGAVVIIAAGGVLALRGVTGGSDQVRLLFWREAWQLIQVHPFGLGLDQFYFYHDPAFGHSFIDASISQTNDQFARHPHNLALEWWLQAGPFGLVAFGWLLARFARHARAALRAAPADAALLALGASAAMTAALLHGLVDSFYGWPDIVFLFWLLLALIEDAYQHRSKDSDGSSVSIGDKAATPHANAAIASIN